MKRTVALLLTVLLVTSLAACGVPTDDKPNAIDPQNVPFQLLAPTASATTTSLPSGLAPVERVTIYLAGTDGLLVPTRRQVRGPVTPAKVVGALLRGPTPDEASSLHTAITSDTKLLGITVPKDGLVTVDLSHHLLDITGRQQILALAQVVYTTTYLPDVNRVRFRFDGDPAEVPDGDGTLTSSPLTTRNYRDLLSQ